MKNNITNSCGNKRGCEITLLPSDSKIKQVNSKKCVIINLFKIYESMKNAA